MTRYSAHCEHPLDDNTVYVDAADRSKASAKIKAAVSLITSCAVDDVEIYNLHDEFEQPETVLHFETAWGGPDTIGDTRACGWVTNPLILFGDEERAAAYARWNVAMQNRAELETRKAIKRASK